MRRDFPERSLKSMDTAPFADGGPAADAAAAPVDPVEKGSLNRNRDRWLPTSLRFWKLSNPEAADCREAAVPAV